jgi:hypothetical protein
MQTNKGSIKEPNPQKSLHSGWSVDLIDPRYIFNNGEFIVTRLAVEDYAKANGLRINYLDPVGILNMIYREAFYETN